MNSRKRLIRAGLIYLGSALTALAQVAAPDDFRKVGRISKDEVFTPTSQLLTPAGTQVDLPEMRPQVIALSPDGELIVTAGKTHELVAIHPTTAAVLQRVPLPAETESEKGETVSTHILKPDPEAQVSYTGLIFSKDGSQIFLSDVNGSIKVFGVDKQHKITARRSIELPPANAPRRTNDIPAGLAISRDGTKLYVALNLSNRLLEMDVASGKPLRFFDVGALPYEVVLVGDKAYVSNWGGRRPDANSLTGPAGRGTKVRVDPVRFIANEGSLTVIDLKSGKAVKEILVGLHSSGMASSPNERHLCVANAGSDNVSVIDTRKDSVVETFSLRWHPNDFYGASPNALAFDRKGKFLFICNGTQNAIAVVSFKPGSCQLAGLIPTGWFPGAIAYDARRSSLYVANIKGTLPGKDFAYGEKPRYTSHQFRGSLSLIQIPRKIEELNQLTQVVLRNYRRAVIEESRQPARPGHAPQPVPERVGEPSVFKHVVYIIKENRSYDQIFGDVKEGNGDPALCVFGEKETPNQHKLVREFALLDNTYCSGILSADGHQWADTAFATDYMEKSFAGFPRSYPDGMELDDVDAVAYAPSGFIWDNALAHGKTLRDYGEFTFGEVKWKAPSGKREPQFLDIYRDFINHSNQFSISCTPAIQSLAPYIMTNTIGWDLTVPDVFRAAQFIKELKEFEKRDKMPDFIIICLPNDHTSGTKHGFPTPAAHVADNDLAFGQIVEAISHSKFWKETCIFAIEDDPQNGFDHVSGYRTTAYVISPYTKRHAVVGMNYNQPGMLRTIELILGLPPMNQMDAGATPMFDCFQEKPDLTPFDAVPNNVPLDQMNPDTHAIKDRRQRRDALVSARLPLDQPDRCPEDVLNKIIWHAQKGFVAPYPAWAITVTQDQDND
ncbi:bifunctional YncE family protein/alkaline phosphatase family protein [Pedosphaera parvula]|uniref:Phosphoesterase n=1 Tax=Pedosphaera parvula (strain Ellin514) TaxID=320771 RepID=B9XDS6_PEDPL|nr:alkaline phosphatase family protein [Pedosphaera parvula]EEF62222.1 phosphoesterase [Pedosphaera parvula Ellin514]